MSAPILRTLYLSWTLFSTNQLPINDIPFEIYLSSAALQTEAYLSYVSNADASQDQNSASGYIPGTPNTNE